MTTQRELDRVVRSWLELGPTDLPEYLLDAVATELPATPQRRHMVPARRLNDMNVFAKVAVAAAAVIAVAVVGINLVPRPGGIGTPGTSAAPSPTRSIAPLVSAAPGAPLTLHNGPLEAGRYAGNPVGTVGWRVTVPTGFAGFGHDGLIPTRTGPGAPAGMGFAVLWARNLYGDPCRGTTADVATGSSVDEFIQAIAAQPEYDTSAPRAVTVGGYHGKQIDIQFPSDLDVTKCTNKDGDPSVPAGTGAYFVWQSGAIGGANVGAQGPGDRFHVRAIDVNGTRVIVLTQDFEATSAADLAVMSAIVESVEFVP